MKKLFFALTMMLTTTMGASAMSYEQARNEALFLTDKMAYELNLTDAQYEAAYEINLDYLMGVTGRSDVFGTYWERRNLDLSYILFDWQWNAFVAATYFYRPLYWEAGYWHFGIYRRYPHRDYFYFGRPHFYATYRGGHAWHSHGGHGYYYGHRDHYRPSNRAHYGMHDRWNRGEFRSPSHHSSTRITGRSDHRPNNRTGFDNRQMELAGTLHPHAALEALHPHAALEALTSEAAHTEHVLVADSMAEDHPAWEHAPVEVTLVEVTLAEVTLVAVTLAEITSEAADN